jgi:hypothetical protein
VINSEQAASMTKKCASCDPYERAFVFSPTQANPGSDTPLISLKTSILSAIQRAMWPANHQGYFRTASLIAGRVYHHHKQAFEMLPESLIAASFQGHATTVAKLLASGYYVRGRSCYNKISPLIAASAGGHTDILKSLLSAGANL